MVEVLKRGAVADETRDVTCLHCQSELRFKRSEAVFMSDQRDGNAIVIWCPVCGTQIWTAA